MRRIFPVVAFPLLACVSGSVSYTPPAPISGPATNVVTVAKPRDEVWRTFIPEIGKSFFVINNVDQGSGLLNVSYSGDPERFVDCGQAYSKVKNLRGERVYRFPAARAQQLYEMKDGDNIYVLNRSMALDGRANIVMEVIGPTSTRVTVTARYVVTRKVSAVQVGSRIPQLSEESLSFSTGQRAAFKTGSTPTTCQPTGYFEQQVLALLKSSP